MSVNRRTRVVLSILLIVGGLEFLLFRSIDRFLHVTKKVESTNPQSLLLSANDIPFRTSDGVNLRGWLILGRNGFPAVIFGHDYGSDRSHALSKLEGLITKLNKSGYFIFLLDFRGHGESGSTSSLGFHESRDVEAAVKALLKYKQIAPRIAVLGVGMGAIAASEAFRSVDEVKLIVLDSIYEDIPSKYSEEMLTDLPFLRFTKPVLIKAIGLNLQQILKLPSTNLQLQEKLPRLYPKAILFVEKAPVSVSVKTLYDATREPKEILQMDATASGELIGEDREKYNTQLEEKIQKYLPVAGHEKTIDLSKQDR